MVSDNQSTVEAAINAMSGKDVFVLMPTYGERSLLSETLHTHRVNIFQAFKCTNRYGERYADQLSTGNCTWVAKTDKNRSRGTLRRRRNHRGTVSCDLSHDYMNP